VPNLSTDRGIWLAGLALGVNVRRLMYQTLIWALEVGHDAGCLVAPLNAKGGERLADPLVYRVRRDLQLCRDLLRGKKLVDETQAIQLSGCEARNALLHFVGHIRPR
jgi:hypothetical protein